MTQGNQRQKSTGDDDSSPLKTVLKWGLLSGLTLAVVGGAVVAGLFYYHGRDLPALLSRKDYNPKETTRVYSANDKLIAEFSVTGGRRTVVELDKIPEHVRNAFLAAEDASFRQHEGIDYLGMMRAFYEAVFYGSRLEGTSTITQQVVKNLLLTPKRKVSRKIKEIILAKELEENLSKNDILYLYLNTIYLGHGNYGIEEAARFYFGKPAQKLTVAEAAVLAGMPQAPSNLDPINHRERAKERRAYVLGQMQDKDFITDKKYKKATSSEIETVDYSEVYPHLDVAPYFVKYIRKKLIDKYGEKKVMSGGLKVNTTLNVEDHRGAKKAAKSGLRSYDKNRGFYQPVETLDEPAIKEFIAEETKAQKDEKLAPGRAYRAVVTKIDDDEENLTMKLGPHSLDLIIEPESRILGPDPEKTKLSEVFDRGQVYKVVPIQRDPGEDGKIPTRFQSGPQVAVVSVNPKTREVVSMVGGYDFENTKFNHATQAMRQTGSTFKPFVYGSALEEKVITPATIYLDSPAVFQIEKGKNWSPKNSDGEWRGPVRVREGLGASRNVVAVRVLKDLGLEPAKDFARRAGIHSELNDDYTLVMGSSELTPLELTNGFSTFANKGKYAAPRVLNKVIHPDGTVDTFETEFEKVIDSNINYLLVDLLKSVVQGYVDSKGEHRAGTGYRVDKLGRPTVGKTGTTNETRDAWFVGFTPKLVTGVWVGFDDNRSLGRRAYGGRVAGPIWVETMKKALKGQEPGEFERPDDGLTTAYIDPKSGKLAREDGIQELFIEGTAPTEYAPAKSGGGGSDFLLDQFGGPTSSASGAKDSDKKTEQAEAN